MILHNFQSLINYETALAVNRKNIELHPEILNDLLTTCSIADDIFGSLVDQLNNTKTYRRKIKLINNIRQNVDGLSQKETESAINVLIELAKFLRIIGGSSYTDFVEYILHNNISMIEEIDNTIKEKFVKRLSVLSTVTRPVSLIAKVEDLWGELPKKFIRSRILSDFRPTFADGNMVHSQYQPAENVPASGLVIHTLVISYRQNSNDYDFHLALDFNALLSLQNTIGRAIEKDRSINELIKQIRTLDKNILAS